MAIDSKDIKNWQEKASRNFGDLSNKTTGRPWGASLWACFTPIDLCQYSARVGQQKWRMIADCDSSRRSQLLLPLRYFWKDISSHRA